MIFHRQSVESELSSKFAIFLQFVRRNTNKPLFNVYEFLCQVVLLDIVSHIWLNLPIYAYVYVIPKFDSKFNIMAIKTSTFGRVELSGNEAVRFLRHMAEDKPNPRAQATLVRGRAVLRQILPATALSRTSK